MVPSSSTTPSAHPADSRLFTPFTAGALKLKNRLVMGPLTRVRSGLEGIPTEDVVEHYRQRSSFGLIIAEGTWPAITGRGYAGQPGIASEQQVAAWRKVTDAVHQEGGTIVLQLMHAGRNSTESLTGGALPEAPSAIGREGYTHDLDGNRLPFPVPQALDENGLNRTKREFVIAAQHAMDAGFDGVELHSANGYFLHEFLAPSTNTRTDEYGGSPENRARFVIEVTRAVAEAIGADRVGIRISPEHNIQGVVETDPDDVRATYTALLRGIVPLGLAFVSVLHSDAHGDLVAYLRSLVSGQGADGHRPHDAGTEGDNKPTTAFLLNNGFGKDATTRGEALTMMDQDVADAVVVGRSAIANPDLVRRWREDREENTPDPRTFYSKSSEGYTDYPFLED